MERTQTAPCGKAASLLQSPSQEHITQPGYRYYKHLQNQLKK